MIEQCKRELRCWSRFYNRRHGYSLAALIPRIKISCDDMLAAIVAKIDQKSPQKARKAVNFTLRRSLDLDGLSDSSTDLFA